jgi:hypothetical protein
VQLAPDVLGLIHEPDSLTFFKKPQVAGGRYLALAFARRAGCDAQEPRQVCVGIRPQPSAMFDAIDTAARRSCCVSPKRSSGGNVADAAYTFLMNRLC